MTGHLDLGVSCLCGSPVEWVNGTPGGGQQTAAVVRCVAEDRELVIDVRLAYRARPGVRPHDWGTYGTGERPDRVARSVERAGLVHSAGGP